MKKLIGLIAVCLMASMSYAQFDAASMDAVLTKNKKELGNNAVSMIFKDGKVIYKKKLSDDFDEKTQVSLGSTSAWLTTILIMQYIDEGKLTLDTKVVDFLPIFAKYSKKYITIRHCLAGMTGIEMKRDETCNGLAKKSESLDEMVNSIVKKEIRTNAGEDYFYTNVGLVIAARVVEIIGKKGFEQLIAQRVLKPLGMKNTTFSPQSGGCANPAEGAFGTANDMMNFFSMVLSKGMFNGKQIVSEASLKLMQTVQVTPSMVTYIPKEGETYEQGLGMFVMEKDINGNAAIIGAPNFNGLWAVIDLCKGYGLLILPEKDLSDARKQVFNKVRENIDEQITGSCK